MKYKTESQILQEAYRRLPDDYTLGDILPIIVNLEEFPLDPDAPIEDVEVTFRRVIRDNRQEWKFVSATHNGKPFCLKSYTSSLEEVKIVYSGQGAYNEGILISPLDQIEKLGFDVIEVDQVSYDSFSDSWVVWVRPFDFELPNYITKKPQ